MKSPDSLHYSTSSNPLSRFFMCKRKEEKTYSSNGDNCLVNREDENFLQERVSNHGSNQSQCNKDKASGKDRTDICTYQIE